MTRKNATYDWDQGITRKAINEIDAQMELLEEQGWQRPSCNDPDLGSLLIIDARYPAVHEGYCDEKTGKYFVIDESVPSEVTPLLVRRDTRFKAMVLVEAGHSAWFDYDPGDKAVLRSKPLLVQSLKQGVQDGRWSQWRIVRIDRDDKDADEQGDCIS